VTTLGLFGKVPTHGDFVARGTGSRTGRSFERWAQMANDRAAEAGKPLPRGPIGFVYRDDAHESLLVGSLVASRDSVGRSFPLASFCELATDGPDIVSAAVPGAMAPVVEQLAELCRTAHHHAPAELFAKLDGIVIPGADELSARMHAQERRLADVALEPVLDRIHGAGDGRYYATEVLLRACESTRRYGTIKNPLILDAHVTSDIELLFWLACIDAGLAGSIGSPATFWDVSARRLLVVMGAPESNTLHYLSGRGVQSQRLWPTATDNADSSRSARARLDDACAAMLAAPGTATAEQFVSRISSLADDSAARAKPR
jgi:type VI secretion system protein ImpM